MKRSRLITRLQHGLFVPGILLLAGCAGVAAHKQGIELRDRGELESALAQLEQATREAPENREFRLHYLNTRAQIIDRLLADAQYERSTGNFEVAESLYRRVLALDRHSAPAASGLAGIERGRRHARLVSEARALISANNLETAERKLALVLQENPQHSEARSLRQGIEETAGRNEIVSPALRQTFQKPVSLEFRESSLRQVLEALSRHSGLNFILDKDVPPTVVVTVFLRQVSVEDALEVILATNQLRRRILNDTTVLVYPDTVAKQGEHQDLIVKNFFLANAEAKQVMNMLKTVLKAKNVFADDKLNLLIMRDTPSMIRLADRMVTIHDVGEPEVMLEVEVLEVTRTSLLNLGIQFPDQLTLTPLPSTGSTVTLQDLKDLNSRRTGAALTPAILNLQRQVGDTNLLANPRIRTHNREKAMIRIGNRVPVITTTATSTGFVSENVLYVDVGLKLEVEPTIFPNNEVSIKMSLEVSSVVREVVSRSGTTTYEIGGRNASTVLRLKDGETQILGGLINDQDRMTANRFPGLGDLPILGRLFSSQRDDKQKTELILSITPRLVRGIGPPADVAGEFWSGTENSPRLNAAPLPRGQGTAAELTAPTAAPLPATGAPAAAPAPAPSAAPRTAPGAAPVPGAPGAVPGTAPAPAPVVPPAPAASTAQPPAGTDFPATPAPPPETSGEPPPPGPDSPPPPPETAPGTAVPPQTELAPALRWDGPEIVKANGIVALTLNRSNPGATAPLPLEVKFDPGTFDAIDVTPASAMRVEARAGSILLSGSGVPGARPVDTDELLRIRFRALKPSQNSIVTALPNRPSGRAADGAASIATLIGITVTP